MLIPPTKILLATDRSPDVALASRAAMDLCLRTGAELHIVHVWANVLSEAYPALTLGGHSDVFERAARVLLEEKAEEVRSGGAEVVGTHLRKGRAAEEIARLADKLGVGLVVAGGRGDGAIGRLFTRSVPEGVARLSTAPTLMVRGGEGAWPPRKLIICDDASEAAARAGNLAASAGRLFGARAVLVRVYPTRLAFRATRATRAGGIPRELSKGGDEDLKDRADELEDILGTRPEIRTPTGVAAGAIREVAEEDGETPLVAMGSRGLGAAFRITMGSVSTDVVRSVAAPVLIVPPMEGDRWSPGTGRIRRGRFS